MEAEQEYAEDQEPHTGDTKKSNVWFFKLWQVGGGQWAVGSSGGCWQLSSWRRFGQLRTS
jgi:hypothetical protein